MVCKRIRIVKLFAPHSFLWCFIVNQHLDVEIATAKINKYATRESGDTVEVVERPHGGVSIVVADGQRSGHSAKAISNIVVRKAISLLAEGVRDGAVARATHDYLHTQRGGRVSAELNIVSVDLATRTIVISRNSRCPVLLRYAGETSYLDEEASAVGIYRNTKPSITELALKPHTTIVILTDGVWRAGRMQSQSLNIAALLQAAEEDAQTETSAAALADIILQAAIDLDHGRPRDDATVLVVKIVPSTRTHSPRDHVRRLSMHWPI